MRIYTYIIISINTVFGVKRTKRQRGNLILSKLYIFNYFHSLDYARHCMCKLVLVSNFLCKNIVVT